MTVPASTFLPVNRSASQNWVSLREHLGCSGLDLDLTQIPAQFAGGLANLNYLVQINGQRWVLRRPPPGELPSGANDMRREYGILRRLYEAYPLAPRAIHFSDDVSVIGAPFLIMEYRPGIVIGGSLPSTRDFTRLERSRLGLQLVNTLAELHAVDPTSVGLSELGHPAGMTARMIKGWQRRAHVACMSTARETPAGIDRVVEWLRRSIVASGHPCLLHSDFKLDNVILDPETLLPSAVIDWDMGTRGDPLIDLATLLSYWTEPRDPSALHALAQMPTAEPGFPSRDDALQAYATRTGRDLTNFKFYRVLAMFKLTAVFMQLHARFLRGETCEEKYRGFGSLAGGLLECTEALIRGELS